MKSTRSRIHKDSSSSARLSRPPTWRPDPQPGGRGAATLEPSVQVDSEVVIGTIGVVLTGITVESIRRQAKVTNEASCHTQETRDQVANTRWTDLRDGFARIPPATAPRPGRRSRASTTRTRSPSAQASPTTWRSGRPAPKSFRRRQTANEQAPQGVDRLRLRQERS